MSTVLSNEVMIYIGIWVMIYICICGIMVMMFTESITSCIKLPYNSVDPERINICNMIVIFLVGGFQVILIMPFWAALMCIVITLQVINPSKYYDLNIKGCKFVRRKWVDDSISYSEGVYGHYEYY